MYFIRSQHQASLYLDSLRPISHLGNPLTSWFRNCIVFSTSPLRATALWQLYAHFTSKSTDKYWDVQKLKCQTHAFSCASARRLDCCQKTGAVPYRCSPIKRLLNENKSGATESFPSGSIHHFNELRCVCRAQWGTGD